MSNIESGGVNARRRSNLELITPDAANEIVALSDTLSYKQVRFYSVLFNYQKVINLLRGLYFSTRLNIDIF